MLFFAEMGVALSHQCDENRRAPRGRPVAIKAFRFYFLFTLLGLVFLQFQTGIMLNHRQNAEPFFEDEKLSTVQVGSSPPPQPQQQGQATPSAQQTAGTPQKPKPVIRDWAAI